MASFDSIAHERLLDLLRRHFKDRPLLDLWERILRAYRGPAGHGLPIGSLTSQHFANFYLSGLDRYVKETLRIRGFVRYMDDVALWSDNSDELKTALPRLAHFLRQERGLRPKEAPHQNRTGHGMDFLGCRVFPTHLTLNACSRRRYHRRLTRLEEAWRQGRLNESELQQRATALVAFTRSAEISSWRFRRGVLLRCTVVSGHEARPA